MYYIGVDGGGSKTTSILTDLQGNVIRTARHGPGNIAVLDRGSIAQLIRRVINDLLQGENIEQVRWTTFAFAGAGRSKEKEIAGEIIKGAGIKHFNIMTDAEILYYSIFGDEAGILISAGTGSICLIKDENNQFQQIGGWGYLLGDEGGGFDIGHQAIRKAINEMDIGEPPSLLTKELLSFYGLQRVDELISITYSSHNPQRLVASCAKLVCDLAEKGEPNAEAIVDSAATALLNLAMKALEHPHFGPQTRIALVGSILQEPSIVNQKFREKAREIGMNFNYIPQQLEPAVAAVLYAIKKSGETVSQSLLQKLKKVTFTH
ncbi:MAG: hypothetical protein D6748_14705 [Calditrichaeota bacterium]|nr:MAG: hypothetical protein D6748_14705 [Calditrichota bacterium]